MPVEKFGEGQLGAYQSTKMNGLKIKAKELENGNYQVMMYDSNGKEIKGNKPSIFQAKTNEKTGQKELFINGNAPTDPEKLKDYMDYTKELAVPVEELIAKKDFELTKKNEDKVTAEYKASIQGHEPTTAEQNKYQESIKNVWGNFNLKVTVTK